VEAVVAIMGIHQFEIRLIGVAVCTLDAVPLVVDDLLIVIIFDERVTQLKATR